MEKRRFLLGFLLMVYLTTYSQMKDISINIGEDADIGHAGDIILPNQGVNDPHIHIFNDRAYLFSSHDKGEGYDTYTMEDWQVFSSQDLVHWKKEFVLKPEDTFIGKKIDKCFATDGAERNGKYYFYFSNFNKSTGVAVSTEGPGGPYVDTGTPVLPEDLTWNNEYDPTIFIEDDNTPYIIWGYTGWGANYQIAELNEDMISLKTLPRGLTLADDSLRNDGSYLHKHNGIYYLNTHHGMYATSDNLFGPYKFRGQIAAHGDHGTFFTWHNQTYYTWGGWQSPYFRYTQISYCHYKDNGEIISNAKVGSPSLGVGRYDANWDKIEAEWYFAASDELRKKENATGFEISDIKNYTYLFFPRMHNFPENAYMQFYISCGNKDGGVIEIRSGGTQGNLLGACYVPYTGSWNSYQSITCKLLDINDPVNIYLVFKGKGKKDELMRLDWFKVSSSGEGEISQGLFIDCPDSLAVGEEFQITSIVLPYVESEQGVHLSLSDNNLATLTTDNKLIGKSQGVVTVYAISDDGNFLDSCNVILFGSTNNYQSYINNIIIYPNPAIGKVTIKGIEDLKYEIQVYNIAGVKQISITNTNTFSISDLPRGFYLINLKLQNRTYTYRLTKA